MSRLFLKTLKPTGYFGRRSIHRVVFSVSLLTLLGSGLAGAIGAAQNQPSFAERLPLVGYYEPSGIVQLPDGRMAMVEDEKATAINLLTPQNDLSFSGEPLQMETLSNLLWGQTKLGALDDLEAITVGKDGFVYAITSHSRTPAGNRFKKREKLVRFRVDGNRGVDLGLLKSLRDQMASLHEDIAEAAEILDANDDNHLGVEGIVYDNANDRLLVGMRGPVIDDKAVVLVIPDPDAVFAGERSAAFSPEPIFLDLDKGGIRAMGYDPKLGGFLILSRQEKKGKKFKLWVWSGDEDQPPQRIRFGPEIDLSKAEGVTALRHNETEQIMLVFDSGRKSKGHDGEYMILSYDQLRLSR